MWKEYFTHVDVSSVREELKLNKPDVGWYQFRNAIKWRNDSGDFKEFDMTPFKQFYNRLSEKLRLQVFEFGFLKM